MNMIMVQEMQHLRLCGYCVWDNLRVMITTTIGLSKFTCIVSECGNYKCYQNSIHVGTDK